MTEDEAAWVREHVWTGAMRRTYRTVPNAFRSCACQSGLSLHCRDGRHGRCVRGTPLRSWETIICGPDGESPMDHRDRGTGEFVYYRHETDVSATGPLLEATAFVWLADRVCRWVCPCECGHPVPEPEPEPVPVPAAPVQGALF